MLSELATETLALVKNREKHRVTLADIAEGAGVELEWLRSFVFGKINIHNASVARVEALHKYMSKTEAK